MVISDKIKRVYVKQTCYGRLLIIGDNCYRLNYVNATNRWDFLKIRH
jgi:hypothetical protein